MMEPWSDGKHFFCDLYSWYNIHPAVTGGAPFTTSRRHPGIFPTFPLPQYHSIITHSSSCAFFILLFLIGSEEQGANHTAHRNHRDLLMSCFLLSVFLFFRLLRSKTGWTQIILVQQAFCNHQKLKSLPAGYTALGFIYHVTFEWSTCSEWTQLEAYSWNIQYIVHCCCERWCSLTYCRVNSL